PYTTLFRSLAVVAVYFVVPDQTRQDQPAVQVASGVAVAARQQMRVAVSMIQSAVARVGYTAVHSPINLLIFSYSHCRPDASHDPVLDLVPDAAAWHAYVEHGPAVVAGSEQVA